VKGKRRESEAISRFLQGRQKEIASSQAPRNDNVIGGNLPLSNYGVEVYEEQNSYSLPYNLDNNIPNNLYYRLYETSILGRERPIFPDCRNPGENFQTLRIVLLLFI